MSPFPPLPGPVPLFHGTSIPEATIRGEGLRAPDFTALIDRIAADNGLDSDVLRAALQVTGGACEREDDELVYLTGGRYQAMSYAARGGEFEELVLERAFELLQAESEIDNDSQMERWVSNAMGPRPPLVVKIDVPEGIELLRDGLRNYQIKHVPPGWIVDVEPVTICICEHMDSQQPVCRPRCPSCSADNCPGWESLETGQPIERCYDEVWSDEEALNRQAKEARSSE